MGGFAGAAVAKASANGSVANLTRRDGEEFLKLAQEIPVRTRTQNFPLAEASEALARLREGRLQGAAVLTTG